jgi:hypothetical protein
MKLPLLDENSKKQLINELIETFSEFLKDEGEYFYRDYVQYPEDYNQAINLLIQKLDIDDETEKKDYYINCIQLQILS